MAVRTVPVRPCGGWPSPASPAADRRKKGGAYDPTGASCRGRRGQGHGVRAPGIKSQAPPSKMDDASLKRACRARRRRHDKLFLHTVCQRLRRADKHGRWRKSPAFPCPWPLGGGPDGRRGRTRRAVVFAAPCRILRRRGRRTPRPHGARKPLEIAARLDVRGVSALVCGVPVAGDRAAPGSARRRPRQRSFNWQSTAFVMRGLRVRLPPLAVPGSTRLAGDTRSHDRFHPTRRS